MGKVEYVSENVTIDNVPNLSALNEIEISLYTVNPNGFSLLKHSPSFSFTLDDGSATGSAYTEEMVDPTYVRIRTTLDDATEGERITLSGCLWPENRTTFREDQLRESYPELFYSVSFIQNTPPDNIKNLQRAEDFFPGTQKCYVAFEVPGQSLNRNKDSSYEVKYFFRNDDNSLELKGSRVLTPADNKNPTAGSDVFMYYFDGQLDDFLTRYEYTVQVIGPHGLTADIRSTDPALGACVLVESAITVLDTPNGLYDEDSDGDYECYEIESEADSITFTAVPGQDGDTLTVTDNGTVLTPTNGNTYTVSGLGRHEIKATSSRTDAFSVTVKKRLRISTTPNPATFTFGTNDTDTYFNNMTDTNGFEYLEVPQSTSTVGYTISPTEEGTTVSGTVDGSEYNGPIDTATLAVGPHTLVAVIHKQYCNDVTTTRKIMVAKTLETPVYTFTPDLNGKKVDNFEYLEVASSTAKASYTIKPSTADSGAKVYGSVGSASFAATNQQTGELSVGSYTIKVTVSKDYMIPREFTRHIKVDSKLTPPEIAFTSPAPNGKRDDMNYEYIEVENSTSTASYTVTGKDTRTGTSVTTVVTAMPNNTQVSTNNSGNLDAGIPGSPKKYKIVATVTKDGYVEQRSTKFVAVVAKLKTPKITFNPVFNGKGRDSSGFYYIEVANSTDQVSYTSFSDDNSPVTVTTKINGWAKNNSGTLGIGDHEIEVTSHCSFQDDVTFTQKVRVVESLKDPVFSCNKLTGNSNGGYEYIEISAESVGVSYSITSANPAGCTITGTDSCTPTSGSASTINFDSSTGSQTNSVVLTLGLGDHIITGTVHNPLYNDHSFTKKVRVVHELQKPTIKFYKESAHSTQINKKSGNPEDTRYLLYDTYNITLAADGTGYLYYTATTSDGSTITIKDDGTTTTSGKLGLGPHNLTMEVSKTNYVTRTFDTPDKVYVEGLLAAPTFTPVGTKTKTDSDGTEHWQYSYKTYDEMPVNVTPGNTGNTVTLYYDGHEVSSASIGYNCSASITAVQTREYCKRRSDKSALMSVTIKPITLTYEAGEYTDGLQVEVQGFGESSGNMAIRGQIYVKGPNTDKEIWHFQGTYQTVTRNQWSTIIDTDDAYKSWSDTFTSPSNTIQVTFHKFRRDKSGSDIQFSSTDWHDFPNITISDIKKGKGENSTAGTSWTYVCDIANRSGDQARPKIRFTATE